MILTNLHNLEYQLDSQFSSNPLSSPALTPFLTRIVNDLTGAVTSTSHTGFFLFYRLDLRSVGCTKIFVLVLIEALKKSVVFGIDTIPNTRTS
jgi:hypothetical protein